MKTIPLTQNKVALVDDADYDFLMQWKWRAAKNRRSWHAMSNRHKSEGLGVASIYMHRIILSPPATLQVDHVSGDGLDNRRTNMRIVTHGINGANRTHQQSRIYNLPMGVWMNGKKFAAGIRINGHRHHLGTFASAVKAGVVYVNARKNRITTELAQLQI